MSKVLIISAHPDDETLGCGGTLLKHAAAGDALYWLIVTQAHAPQWPEEVVRNKSSEVDAVATAYGMRQVIRLGLPAAKLDCVEQAQIMHGINQAVSDVLPETVYGVYSGDVHTDHQAVYRATMGVLKPFRMQRFGVKRILTFETLSSTEAAAPGSGPAFVPTVFKDISEHMQKKLDILALYKSELQQAPLPREASAVKALARYRGASIATQYAEAFMLVREVG